MWQQRVNGRQVEGSFGKDQPRRHSAPLCAALPGWHRTKHDFGSSVSSQSPRRMTNAPRPINITSIIFIFYQHCVHKVPIACSISFLFYWSSISLASRGHRNFTQLLNLSSRPRVALGVVRGRRSFAESPCVLGHRSGERRPVFWVRISQTGRTHDTHVQSSCSNMVIVLWADSWVQAKRTTCD